MRRKTKVGHLLFDPEIDQTAHRNNSRRRR